MGHIPSIRPYSTETVVSSTWFFHFPGHGGIFTRGWGRNIFVSTAETGNRTPGRERHNHYQAFVHIVLKQL